MRVFNQTCNRPLITQGRLANTFWSRLRGLLGAAPLQKGEGLILVGEKSIHTLFMKFPIDVVYVDKNYKVIRADANMGPYRLGPFVAQSAYVLEMPIGIIANTATKTGDRLKFEW
jgi:uncharacterized membrane protein (UPF0127 family)